jgi:mono/diheme cytochrome c family protein
LVTFGVLLLLTLLVLGVSAVAFAQGGDITRGSQIYDANCAVCHGSSGQGRVGVNLSQDWPAIDPAAFTRAVIEQGVPNTAMPGWSQQYGGPLTDQDIEDVVAFVASLSGGRSEMAPTATPLPVTPVPTVPGATGDPSLGLVLFKQNCAMCHGEAGQGVSGAKLTDVFGSIDPQQFVRATVADGIQNTAMPARLQAKGGPLSEKEIDDISAYIISLNKQAQENAPTPTPTPAGAGGGGANVWLILLVIVVAIAIVVAIMAFSGREKSPPS